MSWVLKQDRIRWRLRTKHFLPPFIHTLLAYLCFASEVALLGFYNDSSLFTSPMTSTHHWVCDDRHCVRESAHGGGTQEDRRTIKFGHLQVRTPATCVPGLCFIHYEMPLNIDFTFTFHKVRCSIGASASQASRSSLASRRSRPRRGVSPRTPRRRLESSRCRFRSADVHAEVPEV